MARRAGSLRLRTPSPRRSHSGNDPSDSRLRTRRDAGGRHERRGVGATGRGLTKRRGDDVEVDKRAVLPERVATATLRARRRRAHWRRRRDKCPSRPHQRARASARRAARLERDERADGRGPPLAPAAHHIHPLGLGVGRAGRAAHHRQRAGHGSERRRCPRGRRLWDPAARATRAGAMAAGRAPRRGSCITAPARWRRGRSRWRRRGGRSRRGVGTATTTRAPWRAPLRGFHPAVVTSARDRPNGVSTTHDGDLVDDECSHEDRQEMDRRRGKSGGDRAKEVKLLLANGLSSLRGAAAPRAPLARGGR